MQEVAVNIPSHAQAYGILIGSGILKDLPTILHTEQYTKVFILTDQNVEKYWLPKLHQALGTSCPYLVLPAGEEIKRITSVERIWRALRQAQCDRKSLLVVLGGGVIGDMGGFAASTYMRGMPFVQIPTTLLAQVDSSIGGKTGFDFAGLKNLIGTFAQPKAVIVDTDTLSTLPERELRAGFAEMIKHGLIKNTGYFEQLIRKPITAYTASELAELIIVSTRIKATIVEHDETESGERKLLNFGHTIGHAIEALSWQTTHPLLHGEAVAIGMIAEATLSQRMGYLREDEVTHLIQTIRACGLPTVSPRLPVDLVLQKLKADKKNEGGIAKFTLLEHIGKGIYDQTLNEHVVREVITHSMETTDAA
jgi:shikimate kinase/3-dehydroquinate synthase